MATLDFSMKAGDTKLIDVTVRDPNTGDAVAITSATISWEVYRSKGRATVLTKATGSGISITDGTGGVFRITITAGSDTSGLIGDYVHETKLTFSDSTILRKEGRMTVEPAFNV